MAYGNDFSSAQSADLAEKAAQREAVSQAIGRVMQTGQALREQANINRQFEFQRQNMANALSQRAFENELEKQKTADLARRLDIQEGIGKGYLKLGQDQLDLQRSAGTPAANTNQRFFIQQAQNDAANGIYDKAKYAGKIPDEMHEPLGAQSDQAAAQKNAFATRLQNWADLKNKVSELTARNNDLSSTKGAGAPFSMFGWRTASDGENKEYHDNQAKLLEFNKALSDPGMAKQYDPYLSLDKDGKWHSAVLPSAQGPPGPNPNSPLAPPSDSNDSASSGGGLSMGADGAAPAPVEGTATPNYFNQLGGGAASAARAPGAAPLQSAPFYDRVNQLIDSGMDPVSAKRQVIGEAMTGSPGQ